MDSVGPAAGLTPEEADFEIRGSRSKISRLENGRVKLKNRDVTDLLTLYGVTDEAPASVEGGAGKGKRPPFDTTVANQARIYDYLLGRCFP